MYRPLKLLYLLFIVIAACGRPPDPSRTEPASTEPAVIARVNDRTFTVLDLAQIDPSGSLSSEELGRIVDHWIEREILLMIFHEMNLASDSDVARRIEAAGIEVRLQAIGERYRREAASDSEARRRLHARIEEIKRVSRIERYDWRVE